MAFNTRHLSGGKVTFGRSKIEKTSKPYEQSLYFLWFEFLRFSESYKECCENGGSGKLASLYKDFGDVHNVDFKTWWQKDNRGIELFAEQLTDKIRVIKKAEDLNLRDGMITINIPIDLPKTFILEELNKILAKAGKKSGKLLTPEVNKVSTARYPVVGRFTKDSLDITYKVLKYRTENPLTPWWECAIQCFAGEYSRFKYDETKLKGENKENKRDIEVSLANRAKAYHTKALKMIKNTEQGKFPNVARDKKIR